MIEKDVLIDLYINKKMSYETIGRKLGVSKGQAEYWVKKYAIPKRDPKARYIDITNNVYGRLTVIKIVKNDNQRAESKWLCKCECGNTKEVLRQSLVTGGTKSCGCLLKECYKGHKDLSGTYWHRVQVGAKRRDLEFSITLEYAWDLYIDQNKKCKLSGIDININSNFSTDWGSHTASLDRIDSTKGYIIGNIQWVHRDINQIKWNYSEDYFIELCHAVAKTRKLI